MEFLNTENLKKYPTNILNDQMRCLARVTIMLERTTQKILANAIDISVKYFCCWINNSCGLKEGTLHTLLNYVKNTYPDDIEFIMRLAEEVNCYKWKKS